MTQINMKQEVAGTVEEWVGQISRALQSQGFGVLTRIDLHAKIREKLGKEVAQTVILGACNPELAYEAFTLNPDVTGLLPCNVVIRDLGMRRVSVEITRPTVLLSVLGDRRLERLASDGEARLQRVFDGISARAA